MRVRYSTKHTINHRNFLTFLVILVLLASLVSSVKANPDTITFYSSTSDGYIQCESASWSSSHDAGTGTIVNSVKENFPNAMATTWSTLAHTYTITRSFFYFDTSSLPDNATITGVTLSLYKDSFGESYVSAQKGTQLDTLVLSDFDAFTGDEYGHVVWTGSAYKTITFNAQGLSDINKIGTTKICTREYNHDYLNVDSGESLYRNGAYYSEYSGTVADPKLVVTWTPAVSKAWHDVSSWTVSLVTRTWSSGIIWTANLIARTWSSETSFSLNLQTRIWNWISTAWSTTDLIDSYNESNYNYTSYLMNLHPSPNPKKSAEGQSFTMLSSDHMITSCKFYLYKLGSPTGMAHAVLYAHQGTYGTNSTPTGEALATSDDFDVSTLTLSIQLITFTFNSSQQYVMKANTYYCIAFENPWSGTITATVCPLMGFHYGTPTHSGSNFAYINSGYYPAFTSFDTVFYVYGTPLGFNLLTRQYITVANWTINLLGVIWNDVAMWLLETSIEDYLILAGILTIAFSVAFALIVMDKRRKKA